MIDLNVVPPRYIYLSGPITGQEVAARKAFLRVMREIEKQYPSTRVFNPFCLGIRSTYREYICLCAKELIQAIEIYGVTQMAMVQLPGSDKSRGARLERDFAEAVGIKVIQLPSALEKRQ